MTEQMPLLTEVALRAAVVLAFAWAVTTTMRRASAAARHFVWTCAMAAAALLPTTTAFGPRWEVTAPIASVAPSRTSTTSIDMLQRTSDRISRVSEPVQPTTTSAPVARSPVSYAEVAASVWGIGTTGVLLYVAIGSLTAMRLRRRARPTDVWSVEDLRAIAHAIAIKRIRVLASDEVPSPIACGIWRPAIVMPSDAGGWPQERRHIVLLHECAHIKRRDCLTQLLAQVVCAAYWFNPLVWVAARGLRRERERACDDFVLSAGTRGSDYANHLLQIAQSKQCSRFSPIAAAAVAMARRSQLEGRLMAILDPTIRRKPSFYTRFATAALVVVIALPAAAIQFVESERVVAPGRDIDLGASRLDATVPFRPEPAAQAPTRAAAAQTSTTPDDFTRRALNKSLIEFADEGDLDGINALLAAGADINAAIDGDGTPLIAAAGEGQIDAVALLLERGADPNLIVRGDGTALIAAADEGHSGVVALLLNRGADVDLIAPGDGTALIAAASEGHAGIVDLLIRRGAQVNLIADGDETALIQASDEGHLDVVKLLVERGADVNLGVWGERWDGEIDDRGRWRSTRRQPELQTPLNRARDEGHAAIVAFLISAGARD